MVQKGKNDQFECKLNINYGFRFSNKTKKKIGANDLPGNDSGGRKALVLFMCVLFLLVSFMHM